MKIKEIGGSSGYQAYLHLALDEAVTAFEDAQEQVSRRPPLTEESATPELTLLHYTLEQRRATALILSACCVEAAANLYLGHKATPDRFALLEWAKFMEKWTVLPSLFVPGYAFPKDGELYQDLKRLNLRRNALVHLKEEITRGGAVFHAGSRPEAASDEHVFVGRCRTLPERLLSHVASYDKTDAIMQVRMILAVSPVMQEMKRLVGQPAGGTPLQRTQTVEGTMEEVDQTLYSEVASTWRHFAAWREKTLAGYLTILAGLGFAFSHNVSAPIRAVLLLVGVAVSVVFWILDVRSNQLLNACQVVAQRLEASRGGYSALAAARSAPRVWLTYSQAIDVLVGTVVAGCSAAGALYLARVFADRRDLLWLGGAGLLLACLLVYVLHRIRTADPSRLVRE